MDVTIALVKFLIVFGATVFLAYIIDHCRRRCSKEVNSWLWSCYSRFSYSLRWSGFRYKKVKPESPQQTPSPEKKFLPQSFVSKGVERGKSPSEKKRLLDSPSPSFKENNVVMPSFKENNVVISEISSTDRDILPDLIGESEILTDKGRREIHKWLPNAYKYLTWRRKYASTIDGNSFRTFYGATQSCGAHLVLIKTAEDYRFGSFVPHDVSPNMKKIPSNEIFVFRLRPQKLAGCFRRSGLNENLLCAKTDSYLLGSKPSILLSDGFRFGSSNPSKTFDSPMLSRQVTFNIICIEIWQIKC